MVLHAFEIFLLGSRFWTDQGCPYDRLSPHLFAYLIWFARSMKAMELSDGCWSVFFFAHVFSDGIGKKYIAEPILIAFIELQDGPKKQAKRTGWMNI